MLSLILKAHNFADVAAIIVRGLFFGFFSAALPQLCQPFMRKITGSDATAIGHFNMVGYALSGYIGKLFGDIKTAQPKTSFFLNGCPF